MNGKLKITIELEIDTFETKLASKTRQNIINSWTTYAPTTNLATTHNNLSIAIECVLAEARDAHRQKEKY